VRTTLSDLTYAITLLCTVGTLAALKIGSLEMSFAAMLVSVLLGLLPFGRRYLRRQLLSPDIRAVRQYLDIWREHSGWSFLGVVTTEATVNAHVYIVTLIAGPAAYAPIAATALMIRPIGVAQNALAEFERANMARELGANRLGAALRAVILFRLCLVAAWIGTTMAVFAMFLLAPHLVFPERYSLSVLMTGVALWLLVSGMRLIRAPESTLLQAAGQFRPLAHASLVSCGVSVGGVAMLLFLVGPLWSICGIVAGEAVFTTMAWRQAHRWRRAQIDDSAEKPVRPLTGAVSMPGAAE
jgi:hypothetical protein